MRIGYTIRNEHGMLVARVGQLIRGFGGEAEGTINQAEYLALIYALRHAIRLGFDQAECIVDSQLIVKQVLGEYRVKDKKLARLVRELIDMRPCFSNVTVGWDSRVNNEEADELTHLTVFEEVTFNRVRGGGRRPRKLPTWMAARIRRWFAGNEGMNEYTVSRAVGVDVTTLRQLLKEATYRGASETNLPNWSAFTPELLEWAEGYAAEMYATEAGMGHSLPPAALGEFRDMAIGNKLFQSLDDGTGWPDSDEVDEVMDPHPVI